MLEPEKWQRKREESLHSPDSNDLKSIDIDDIYKWSQWRLKARFSPGEYQYCIAKTTLWLCKPKYDSSARAMLQGIDISLSDHWRIAFAIAIVLSKSLEETVDERNASPFLMRLQKTDRENAIALLRPIVESSRGLLQTSTKFRLVYWDDILRLLAELYLRENELYEAELLWHQLLEHNLREHPDHLESNAFAAQSLWHCLYYQRKFDSCIDLIVTLTHDGVHILQN